VGKGRSPEWNRIARNLRAPAPRIRYGPSDFRRTSRAIGFAVPPSYKAFVATFGCGELFDMFIVWPPPELPDLSRARAAEIRASSLMVRGPSFDELVPFGGTVNGDTMCWRVPPHARMTERAICIVDRDCARPEVKVADDLLDFVQVLLDDSLDKRWPPGSGQKWELPHKFVPTDPPRVPSQLPEDEQVDRVILRAARARQRLVESAQTESIESFRQRLAAERAARMARSPLPPPVPSTKSSAPKCSSKRPSKVKRTKRKP
jgi:hypothetical protein